MAGQDHHYIQLTIHHNGHYAEYSEVMTGNHSHIVGCHWSPAYTRQHTQDMHFPPVKETC